MAFKLKNVTVDIDLDFSEFPNLKEEDKFIKPIKTPSGQESLDWAKKVSDCDLEGTTQEELAQKLKEKFEGDPVKAAYFISENIDYWYGKGTDWWMENLPIEAIIQVFNYLIEKVFNVKKK